MNYINNFLIFLKKNYKHVIFIGIGIFLLILALNKPHIDEIPYYSSGLSFAVLFYSVSLLSYLLRFAFYYICRIFRLKEHHKYVVFIGIGIFLLILVLSNPHPHELSYYNVGLLGAVSYYSLFLLLYLLKFAFYYIWRIIHRKKIDSKEGDKLDFSGVETQGVPESQIDMVINMREKNPELFKKITEEIQAKIKGGMDQQTASMEVMKKYSDVEPPIRS